MFPACEVASGDWREINLKAGGLVCPHPGIGKRKNRKAWRWLEFSEKRSITSGPPVSLRVIFEDFKNVAANEKFLAGGAIGIFR